MNKQSNVYTIIYIIVMVVVVGAALAFTALGLKSRQQENINADKMKQILASVHITPAKDSVTVDFDRYITRSLIVNSLGEELPGNAFDINTAEEAKKPVDQRALPVYECTLAPGDVKYIVPVNGAGLWGPIWGYVAIDSDGSTVYGAYFAHQGETPGLGAEIEKPAFSDQFEGKHMFKDDKFLPVAVMKAGQVPTNGEDYVDGISGGTITSKGVGSMIDNCIGAYSMFLKTLSENQTR
ncbi:NADH:ubiquinone reductase (Na(+)-transporting) subunit C [uncultured Muribaculum sp.]|uniref:NADH:ubiquinone reductase (Na(+)-transporting) subunit C n=1 Tax=uncultured Muribaculum sp. TaxID=1918613 RepID=UPI0025D686B3|nr:NADH:ubiquinone reductase (Na(+)-transporting) subunit C [uncultured Muribaculum sp.]